jgi:hypothetical protein
LHFALELRTAAEEAELPIPTWSSVMCWTSVRKVKEGETTNDLFAHDSCQQPPKAQ